MSSKLPNSPVKGTRDWEPSEFAVRQYIFETWRQVNRRFGYAEYLTPLLESAEIYRAKSGEDIGGKELMILKDQAGRELALRPEMTPSVTRMVSRFYRQAPKPLRLFSIANFWRNEKPQRGRNREFWQLNSDIFGSELLTADLEILQLALDLMLAFNPPPGAFNLNLNHRQLIDAVLSEVAEVPASLRLQTVHLLDKFEKLPLKAFQAALQNLGLSESVSDRLTQFITSQTAEQLLSRFPGLRDNPGYQQTTQLINELESLGYGDWVVFNPSIIRGFDYYDGMVFEIFDNHPQNNRAMFGGGRYNGLADLFGKANIPAVGFAPGDETTRLFLESWNLIPAQAQANQTLYFPLLEDELASTVRRLTLELRRSGYQVEQGLEPQSIKQALSYANKRDCPAILLLGQDEAAQSEISLKDMTQGTQHRLRQVDLVAQLEAFLL